MKLVCKAGIIALSEIKTNVKVFVVFVFILALLFSAVISIFGLALQIPNEIMSMIKDTKYSKIDVYSVSYERLEYTESFQTGVSYSVRDLDHVQINISKEDAGLDEEGDIPILGNVQRWLPNNRNASLDILSEQIIRGSKWEQEDNFITESGKLPIFLSNNLAELMSVDVGDTITLYSKNGMTSVNCKVKGIYNYNLHIWYSYFINMPTYEMLEGNKEQMGFDMSLTPYRLQDFQKIIINLKNQYYIVKSESDITKAFMYIIYSLYFLTFSLFIICASILNNLIQIYFSKRRKYFGIYKAIGMSNQLLMSVTFFVSQIIMTISFILSIFIAPKINKYSVNIIKTLFDGMEVKANILVKDTIIIYLSLTIIGFLVCLMNKKQFKMLDIINIIRKE